MLEEIAESMTPLGITAAVVGCGAFLLLLVMRIRDQRRPAVTGPADAAVAVPPVPAAAQPAGPKSAFKAYVHVFGPEPLSAASTSGVHGDVPVQGGHAEHVASGGSDQDDWS